MTKETKQQKVTVAGVLQRDGKILLLQRSKDQAYFAGMYEFAGGKVEFGEDHDKALIREFKEETGLEVTVGKYLRTFSWVSDDGKYHVTELVYRVDEAGAPKEVALSDEHQELAWVDRSNIDEVSLSPEIQTTVDMVLPVEDNLAEIPVQGDVNSAPAFSHLDVFTDGGSRGNPGPSASGYVIMTTEKAIIEEGGEYLGVTTNNQAEYQAVKLALEQAQKYSPQKLDFYIDSLLVVNQMNGSWKIKNRDLWPIHEAIKKLAENFEEVTFTHVRREYNTLADEQVNIVLDSQQGK